MRAKINGATAHEKVQILTALIGVCKLAARDVDEGLTEATPEDLGHVWRALGLAEDIAASIHNDLPDVPREGQQ